MKIKLDHRAHVALRGLEPSMLAPEHVRAREYTFKYFRIGHLPGDFHVSVRSNAYNTF